LYGSSLTLARRQLTLENETTFFLRERERERANSFCQLWRINYICTYMYVLKILHQTFFRICIRRFSSSKYMFSFSESGMILNNLKRRNNDL